MVKEVELILIGDPHLLSLNKLFPNLSINPDTFIYKSLETAIEYAIENGIIHVIILGDVFDHPNPEQEDQKRFLDFLLQYKSLKFWIIAGNHDYSDNDGHISINMSKFVSSVSDQLSHVRFFTNPELVEIEGIPFSFLPWPNCKTLQKNSVNIAHVEIAGFRTDSGRVLDKGYEISKNGIWYIGHLHRRQEPYYPGNMFQKSFGEPYSPKGFFHCTVRQRNGMLTEKHTYIAVKPPFRLENVKIQEYSDLKFLKKPNDQRIIQYKLHVKKGIDLPVGFLEDYPNVIDVFGKLTNKELSSLEKEGFTIDSEDMEFDFLDSVEYLLLKDGLTNKEVKRAIRIVDNLVSTIKHKR